jgi:hypothetical protein
MTKELNNEKKWVLSFYTAIIALIIMNPYTFKIVNWITSKMGFPIANSNGCPNGYGLLLHAIVFLVLIRLFMSPSLNLPGLNE